MDTKYGLLLTNSDGFYAFTSLEGETIDCALTSAIEALVRLGCRASDDTGFDIVEITKRYSYNTRHFSEAFNKYEKKEKQRIQAQMESYERSEYERLKAKLEK